MTKKLLTFSCIIFLCFSTKAQVGLTKANITSAYSIIKTTFNFPETCSLTDYQVYKGDRGRKCIDIAIIEIKAQNAFGVSSLSCFMCYFFNGKFFYHHNSPVKPSFVSNLNAESADKLIEPVLESAIEIEKSIIRSELCQTQKEIDAQKKYKEDQERLKVEEAKKKLEQQESDKKTITMIEEALEKEQYYSAYMLKDQLFDKTNEIVERVNNSWSNLKATIDSLYSDYLSSIETQKKLLYEEYFLDKWSFTVKYQNNIFENNFKWKGKTVVENYLKLEEKFTWTSWSQFDNFPTEESSVYYWCNDDKHTIIPTNPYFHHHIGNFYDIDEIKVAITFSENLSPIALIKTYKNNIPEGDFYISNNFDFQVPYLYIDYPKELKVIMNKIYEEGGIQFDQQYPKESMMLEYSKILNAQFEWIEKPENGFKNEKFEKLVSATSIYVNDCKKFKDDVFLEYNLHPAFELFLQRLNNNTDSLIIVSSKSEQNFEIDDAFVVDYNNRDHWSGIKHFYFIPLKKGFVEYNNSINSVRIFSGNSYKDFRIDKGSGFLMNLKGVYSQNSELIDTLFTYSKYSYLQDKNCYSVLCPDYFLTNDLVTIVYFPVDDVSYSRDPYLTYPDYHYVYLNGMFIQKFPTIVKNINKYLLTNKPKFLDKADSLYDVFFRNCECLK